MRGVLARWILLATAVALMLLGRPTEHIPAPRTDDEQASLGYGDDVSLRSERRSSATFRLVGYELDDGDDEALSVFLDEVDDLVARAAVRDLPLVSQEREAFHEWLSSSSSARGPPAIRA